jgi:ketosteroid isomerase-like protein
MRRLRGRLIQQAQNNAPGTDSALQAHRFQSAATGVCNKPLRSACHSAPTRVSNPNMTHANNNTDIARDYFQAVQNGDVATLVKLVDEKIVWRQPGSNQFSGERRGRNAVFEMLGAMMQCTAGSFAIDKVHSIMGNGEMVAASIHFSARRDGKSMSMEGVDVLRIKDGAIVEVWLFSSDQTAEDEFWGR